VFSDLRVVLVTCIFFFFFFSHKFFMMKVDPKYEIKYKLLILPLNQKNTQFDSSAKIEIPPRIRPW